MTLTNMKKKQKILKTVEKILIKTVLDSRGF